jgi:hypothetical protein
MKGTSFSATAPMRLTPPSSTKPVKTAITTPETQGLMPKAVSRAPAMLLDWTMLPIPKPASPPKIAKAAPSQRQRLPKPFLMAYMGPPTCSP